MGIRKTIPYKALNKLNIRSLRDHKTEAQSIEIPTRNRQKVRITNVYVPPHNSGTGVRVSGSSSARGPSGRSNSGRVNNNTAGVRRTGFSGRNRSGLPARSGRSSRARRSRDNGESRESGRDTTEVSESVVAAEIESDFDTRRWPAKNFDIIGGDLNAHSISWDNSMAGKNADRRARIIEDWATDNNMVVMNDGTPTHVSRSSGSQTTPDVTLAHASIVDRITWRKLQGIGSDHIPILITYHDSIPRVNNKPSFKWRLKSANWTDFRTEVERNIPDNYEKRMNVNKLEKK